MANYIDKIMSNHVFNSDSSDYHPYLYSDPIYSDNDLYATRGGSDNKTSVALKPTGGFPPIIIIDEKEKEKEKELKSRLIAPTKSSVSIKDILNSKKK